MAPPFSILLFLFMLYLPPASSALVSLARGSSLYVENHSDVLVSPNGDFSAGFFRVGINAFSFAVWHGGPDCSGDGCVPVWMANRNDPVNSKGSRLSLTGSGDLILTDAGDFPLSVWSSGTGSSKAATLQLKDTGNLVLAGEDGETLWQSFDFPTDTLLPTQVLKRDARVISSRSRSNYSEGFYSLHFGDDDILRIIFSGPAQSSSYWPQPWLPGRFTTNTSKSAVLDPTGHFLSSDNYEFFSSDYGVILPRRLRLDPDGNLRLYSLDPATKNWLVTWDAFNSMACLVFGVCGNNSICSYNRTLGRSCSCVPGYERVDPDDWSSGCQPRLTFQLSDPCSTDVAFFKVPYVDFYGNDYNTTVNTTFDSCRSMCSGLCSCRGFQYTFDFDGGVYKCYLKTELLNGNNLPSFPGEFFIKFNKSATFTTDQLEKRTRYNCTGRGRVVLVDRMYPRKGNNAVVNFMLWFAVAVAGIEILVVFVVWFFFFRNQQDIGYSPAPTGFQRFAYDKLKKATKNFSKEIGRGAGGIVYKAVLPDDRVAAVKSLNEATTSEADFLAEVSTIGKLNHMNLIEMWGYCAEGRHRLLVYEYMEHGSLAENLSSPELDWRRRFDIAVGTAKGLAYLHEECLEWVLHCDVKPQNILLDSDYRPKVADFGLSKLMDRGKGTNPEFSRIRGTRGYMAPEWVSNLPITAKVDVYSYGIVMLELVTGLNPAATVHSLESGGDAKRIRLVTWVQQKMQELVSNPSRVGEIVDPNLRGNYDKKMMEILIQVALQCVAEDKDRRPTMGEVVEMLLRHENSDRSSSVRSFSRVWR